MRQPTFEESLEFAEECGCLLCRDWLVTHIQEVGNAIKHVWHRHLQGDDATVENLRNAVLFIPNEAPRLQGGPRDIAVPGGRDQDWNQT